MERIGKGIAVLLFAILLQLCSTGMELFAVVIGIIGLIFAFTSDRRSE